MADPDGYWSKLETELDRLNAENQADESDPWANLDLTAPPLTPEQRAALADQPRQPRLSGTAPVADHTDPDSSDAAPTGKAPGASEDDLA